MKKWEIESVTVSITLWAVGATVYFWAKQTVETTELANFFSSKANISQNI